MRPREHRYSQISYDLDFMVISWKLDVFGNCRELGGRNSRFTEIGRMRELGLIWRKDQAAKFCSPKCPDSISSCCFWLSTNLLPLGGTILRQHSFHAFLPSIGLTRPPSKSPCKSHQPRKVLRLRKTIPARWQLQHKHQARPGDVGPSRILISNSIHSTRWTFPASFNPMIPERLQLQR